MQFFIKKILTPTFLLAMVSGSLAAASYGQSATPVEVQRPQRGLLEQQLQLSGSVRALRQTNLSSKVDGAVAQVLVDAGSQVKAGDVLVKLDQRLAALELQRLQAELKGAQVAAAEASRLLAEAEQLSKSQHLPANEVALRRAAAASSQADLAAAQAQVALQQQRLDFHQITAPFSGVVVERLSETGEWINRGTAVLQLAATDEVYLDVQVPQEQFASIRRDSEIRIRPDTQPDRQFPAQIAASVPVADASSRSFRLRLVSEEGRGLLLPGSSATATFTNTQRETPVLMVSRDALLRNPDSSFALFVVGQQDGQATAQRRQVEVGQIVGNSVEIVSGLGVDEPVVVRGNEILRNNQAVKVLPSGQ